MWKLLLLLVVVAVVPISVVKGPTNGAIRRKGEKPTKSSDTH